MNTMWRSTVVYLACATIGIGLMSIIWSFRAPPLLTETVAALTFVIGALVLEVISREKLWSKKMSAWMFWLTTLILTVTICLNHEYYIRNNLPFEPFVGCKIIAAVIPLICPPSILAAFGSLALVGLVPLQRYYTWDLQTRNSLGIQEPWITLFFAIIAGVIYIFRLRLYGSQKREVELLTRMSMLQRFVNLLLGVQHLLNSPLQTVELMIDCKNRSDPKSAAVFARSFAAIRRVTQILALANDSARWSTTTLPSLPDELEFEMRQILNIEKPT